MPEGAVLVRRHRHWQGMLHEEARHVLCEALQLLAQRRVHWLHIMGAR
jgi:hypothetical protein